MDLDCCGEGQECAGTGCAPGEPRAWCRANGVAQVDERLSDMEANDLSKNIMMRMSSN
jgi:hypothetical protein